MSSVLLDQLLLRAEHACDADTQTFSDTAFAMAQCELF